MTGGNTRHRRSRRFRRHVRAHPGQEISWIWDKDTRAMRRLMRAFNQYLKPHVRTVIERFRRDFGKEKS